MRFLLSFLLFTALSPAQVVISQIYGGGGNSGATLRNDFVELFNRGAATVSVEGWSVQYASATITTWQVTTLKGTIAPGGYLLVQEAAGAAGTVSLPTPDVAGTIAMGAGGGNIALVNSSTPLTGPTPTGAIEVIAYSGLANTTAYLRQSGGCKDGFSVATPAPRNSASAANDCTAQLPFTPISIHAVQGSGHTSEFNGRNVVVTGIVTARRSNAFWIQVPEKEYDNDPNTSEGIYVFTQTTPPVEAAVGNLVRVTGMVSEYAPATDPTSPTLTELIAPQVELVLANQPLPAPVLLTRNGPREALEGMRVHVPTLIAVSPTGGTFNEATGTSTSNGVFYGVLPGTPRPVREPGLPQAEPTIPNAPIFDGNPERIRVDSRGQTGVQPLEVTTNTIVPYLAGPLDYAFRTYTIVPDASDRPIAADLIGIVPIQKAGANEFTIASFNMQRLVGTGATEARLTKIALAIRTVLNTPDILAVAEVGDLKTLEALATRLGYKAYLEEGNDIGGIDVGFLVNEARVKVVGVTQQGKATTYTNPNTNAQDTLFDRPPLFLDATVNNYPVTVVANHLLSLLSQADARVQAKRKAQAEYLANVLATRRSSNVILVGDFNAFPFNDGYVDVMGIIKGTPQLGWVLAETLAPEQGYSYVFDGNAQTLDHIVVNANARSRWKKFLYAHINADYPESFRNDPTRPERSSDHDVPVAYFSTDPIDLAPASVTNAATFFTGPVAPGEIVTVFGSGFSSTTRVTFDGRAADVFGLSSTQFRTTVPYSLLSTGTTDMRVQYDSGKSATATLDLIPYNPGIFSMRGTGTGPGAILNQDYSLNDATKPAAKGSVVMIFATGDGIQSKLAGPAQQASVTIGALEAEVLYAGPAPGLVTGAVQVNARVPDSVQAGNTVPVVITFGRNSSARGVTMSIR